MSAVTRIPRGSAVPVTVGRALDLGLDPDGGKWVVICEHHSTVVNVDTKAAALAVRSDEFCAACGCENYGHIFTPTGCCIGCGHHDPTEEIQ